MSSPVVTRQPLPQSCENCRHYDGDHFCALPAKLVRIDGFITHAASVVCDAHNAREDVDAAPI